VDTIQTLFFLSVKINILIGAIRLSQSKFKKQRKKKTSRTILNYTYFFFIIVVHQITIQTFYEPGKIKNLMIIVPI